jgi:hypothetical protein
MDVKGNGRALLKFLSQKLPGGTHENHGKPQSEQPVSGPIIELGPLGLKAALLSHPEPRRSVIHRNREESHDVRRSAIQNLSPASRLVIKRERGNQVVAV